MMLVDSHCHIPMIQDIGVDTVIANAHALAVRHMLCVSIDLETYPEILKLAQQYKEISASVGVHPNTPMQQEVSEDTLSQMASNSHVVGIGETGLDYCKNTGDMEWQKERFRTHIRVAKLVNKPLIIHMREANEDTLSILEEEGANKVGGVMHCFTENKEIAFRAIAINFYISFSGIVTFKNAQQVQETARHIPVERMLLETDSPYLAPIPYRGKTNQPSYTYYIAEYIAKLRGVDIESIAEKTTENFSKLFDITLENS